MEMLYVRALIVTAVWFVVQLGVVAQHVNTAHCRLCNNNSGDRLSLRLWAIALFFKLAVVGVVVQIGLISMTIRDFFFFF